MCLFVFVYGLFVVIVVAAVRGYRSPQMASPPMGGSGCPTILPVVGQFL